MLGQSMLESLVNITTSVVTDCGHKQGQWGSRAGLCNDGGIQGRNFTNWKFLESQYWGERCDVTRGDASRIVTSVTRHTAHPHHSS